MKSYQAGSAIICRCSPPSARCGRRKRRCCPCSRPTSITGSPSGSRWAAAPVNFTRRATAPGFCKESLCHVFPSPGADPRPAVGYRPAVHGFLSTGAAGDHSAAAGHQHPDPAVVDRRADWSRPGSAVFGPLSDRIGRLKPLALSLLLFIFSSAMCALTRDINMLIVWLFYKALPAPAARCCRDPLPAINTGAPC